MGGKSQKQTTVQNTEPWREAQPALKSVLGQAGQLFNQGVNSLNSRSVDDLYGQTSGALSNILSGSGPLANMSATANGDFLNNNPYLHSMFSALSGDVQDAVNSQFSAAGRTGSPAHAGVLAKELGNLGTRIYADDYARERQNQLSAGNQLGQFSLSGIGAAPGAYEFGNADLNELWQNLSRYGAIAQGIGGMGGTSTSTTSTPNNTLGQILGIGASIAGMASGNPFAAAGLFSPGMFSGGQSAAPWAEAILRSA